MGPFCRKHQRYHDGSTCQAQSIEELREEARRDRERATQARQRRAEAIAAGIATTHSPHGIGAYEKALTAAVLAGMDAA